MAANQVVTQKHVSFETRIAIIRTAIDDLLDRLNHGQVSSSEWTFIAEMLETLPLNTAEYDLAHRRLSNSLRYLEAAEFGAARYELRLIYSVLPMIMSGEPSQQSL